MKYMALVHPAGSSWNAYVPDLPGLAAAAPSREQAEQLIREAIVLHIESLREHGDEVPPPSLAIEISAA